MKNHTTNYLNTFIVVADDCIATNGQIPPIKKEEKTVASLQFELVHQYPYRFTSDDVIFQVFAMRNDISESELEEARATFFSKGQPCFRASPLTKRYGWGLHSNAEGKIALFGRESEEYERFMNDETVSKVKAMKSGR